MTGKKLTDRERKALAEEARAKGERVPFEVGDDGNQSRLHKAYETNAEKPDPSTVAQVQVLKAGGS